MWEIQHDTKQGFKYTAFTTSTDLIICQPKYSSRHAVKIWTSKTLKKKRQKQKQKGKLANSCLTFLTTHHTQILRPEPHSHCSQLIIATNLILEPIPWLPNQPNPQIIQWTFNPPISTINYQEPFTVLCQPRKHRHFKIAIIPMLKLQIHLHKFHNFLNF